MNCPRAHSGFMDTSDASKVLKIYACTPISQVLNATLISYSCWGLKIWANNNDKLTNSLEHI